MKKIKIMVVDDSAFVRVILSRIFGSDPELHVISTASDPIYAASKLSKLIPDVITLDIEMPRMNGLTFLKKLMSNYAIPVVVISGLTEEGGEMALKAFEYGAIEVISKPKFVTQEFFEDSKILICDAVKAAAQAKFGKKTGKYVHVDIEPKLSVGHIIELNNTGITLKSTTDKIIAIGASTGGTIAIEVFLKAMPPDCPGIVIVQHMPELFTRSFAERLNKVCRITVKEGIHGELIIPGKAIIAPGNQHMMVKKNGAKYSIVISDGKLVNRHRPSVDVLFRSVANCAGSNSVGILMTGMGDDGARGLLDMKIAGAFTIAQNEESCIVFGMPKVAINLGAAMEILPLEEIAKRVTRHFR
jgi:two-component system chemotaxis response regulator CheB